MHSQVNRKAKRRRIRYRIRKDVEGTAARPRVAIHRTLKHIYAQAIDDEQGRTVAFASTREAQVRSALDKSSNIDAAKQVGKAIADKLKDAGVETIVFDRGGFLYHGRVKALAEAIREGGLRF